LFSAIALAQAPQEQFLSVTPKNFDSGGAISRQFHLNAESYKRSATISRGPAPYGLAENPNNELAALEISHSGIRSRFADYVTQDALLDGVIVLHGGEILFEAYPHMRPRQRHYAWSVSKVVASALLATLVADKLVDMGAPIERYVPSLEGSAWAGTRVRDIANMASGIDCRDSDGYQDSNTCIYRMEESLGITASTGEPQAFIEQLQDMRRLRPAGTRNEYVSANTNVLMLLIEHVTGTPYADALRTRIWERIGAESDALMSISAEGYAYASGGLSAELRDIARFGLMFTEPERFADIANSMIADLRGGGGIVLADEDRERLTHQFAGDTPTRAGWQWDHIWNDGALFKGGYLGQGLYVDPERDLVIAWFGTGIDYDEKATDMLPVARQLAVSGLFDDKPRPPTLNDIVQANNAAGDWQIYRDITTSTLPLL
jgi:CubicO group peptidase (beta-lactamase class C family)